MDVCNSSNESFSRNDTFFLCSNGSMLNSKFSETEEVWMMIYFVIHFLILLLGLPANFLVIWILQREKRKRKPVTDLIIALAANDFFVNIVGTPFSTISSLVKGWIFGDKFCQFYAFVMSCAGYFSECLMTVIAIERFLMVVSVRYKHLVTRRNTKKAIIFCLSVSIVTAAIPILGLKGYGYEGLGISCGPIWDESTLFYHIYLIFLFIFLYTLPVTVIIFSYLGIFINSKWKTKNVVEGTLAQKKSRREKMLALTGFSMTGVFYFIWTPYAIISFWKMFGFKPSIPRTVESSAAVFAKTASMWDPLVYGFVNPSFGAEFRKLFRRRENREDNISLSNTRRLTVAKKTPNHLAVPKQHSGSTSPVVTSEKSPMLTSLPPSPSPRGHSL